MKTLKCILFLGLFLTGISNVFVGTVMGSQVSNEDIFFLASGKLHKIRIETDTINITQVSTDAYSASELSVLPDGRYAYTKSLKSDSSEIRTHLTFGPSWNKPSIAFPENLQEISDISLSPDGTKLLFVAHPNLPARRFDLYCKDLATETVDELISGGIVKAPSWSPDGSKIAFYYGKNTDILEKGGFALHVIDADGQNERKIAEPSKMTRFTPDRNIPPLWSLDSKNIFFEANYEANRVSSQIYVVALDKASPIRLGAGICTSISADGKKIYFCDGGLYVMNVDGTNHECLGFSEGPNRGTYPKLSPSGSLLGFATWNGIYVMKPDGTEVRKLSGKAPSKLNDFFWVSQ